MEPSRWPIVAALLAASALVVIASQWGESLLDDGIRMKIHTPPLTGTTDWRPGRTMLPVVLVAVLTIAWFPVAATRIRWRWLLILTAVVAVGWAVALAVVDGREALTNPLLPGQYIRTVPRIKDLGFFLGSYSRRLASYNIHTQGHPPGMVVLLWVMDRAGFGGVNPNAWLVFLGGGVGSAAALVGAKEVAGEAIARRAAPFLALTPAAIWWTSGDAFFAGVSATAVTLVILATGRDGRRSDVLAALGGLAFAAAAYLSYGLVLLAIIPVAIAAHRRRWRPVLVAAVVVAAVVLAVSIATGFLWWEGLAATRVQYFVGVAKNRPYEFFVVANLAALSLAVGPAAIAGFIRLRGQPLAWLVGAAAVAVLIADVSGMSKAEVERIWLPFVPWLVIATAALAVGRKIPRSWLAAQAGVAVLVAVAVRSPW